ncbi:hypothetical protein SSAG_00509 [Streptomyces sp. Mg1]|nr:hypothetical protein SSAG_00509 [Streptomyces sp. Mg1]
MRRNTFATAADAPDNDAESLVVAARVKAACLPAPPAPPLRPGPHERVPHPTGAIVALSVPLISAGPPGTAVA